MSKYMKSVNFNEIKVYKYSEKDYFEVINFLGELYQLDRLNPYWLPSRWEYAAFLVYPLSQFRGLPDWKQFIKLLKYEDKIIGVVNSEKPDDDAFIHIHPDYKDLETYFIQIAEKVIGQEKVTIWSLSNDHDRIKILKKRGYKEQEVNDYLNWCDPKKHNSNVLLPKPFVITSFQEGVDLDSRIECVSKAFGSKGFPKEVYYYMQKAPSYNPNIDLVITLKNKVVSLCTVWHDRQNNIGYFEPVATHPDFQKRGLGKAILNEGLKRLNKMGVRLAYVGASGDDRKEFYNSSGFTTRVLIKPWKKQISTK
jgi:ribosomal protein S18 acetylase RimI-like enzyme